MTSSRESELPAIARTAWWGVVIEVLAVLALAVVLQQVAAAGVTWGIDHETAFENGIGWDLRAHVNNAAISNELGIPWPHFLPYVLMSGTCGFCSDRDQIMSTLPAIVGLMIAAKFLLTHVLMRFGMGLAGLGGRIAGGRAAAMAAVAVLLGICFSLPFPNLYRGQLPANQWHNTTTFVLMPVALALFGIACAYLRRPGWGLAVAIAAVGLLSISAKPNFAMAFIPAFPLMLLVARIERRWKLVGTAATAVMGLGLVAQYVWMYRSESFATLRTTVLESRGQDPSLEWGLTIAPFEMWANVSPSIPLSILATLLFPLLVIVARPRVALRSRELGFAWALFICALLAFVVLAETGRASGAANFRWGGIATAYILFVASAAVMLAPLRETRSRLRDALAWAAFAAHVAAGIYVLRVFYYTGTYLHPDWSTVVW